MNACSLADALEMVAFLDKCQRERAAAVIAVVIGSEGSTDVEVGWRLFFTGEHEATGSLTRSRLAADLEAHACRCLAERTSRVVTMADESGSVEVFVEVIEPALPVVLFGGGHDAVPLVRLMKEMGWHVTVADGRPSYAQARRFPLADQVVLTEPGNLLKGVPIQPESVAVIMNHSYAVDREILRQLLCYSLRYVGVLGPRARTEKMLRELGLESPPSGMLPRSHWA